MKNNKLVFYLIFSYSLLLLDCSNPSTSDHEKYKNEILKVETDFARMGEEKGIKEAFLYFADKAAVMNREKIVKGHDEISDYFENMPFQDFNLKWEPDFVDVSKDGTMAYTYGKFTFEGIDQSGQKREGNGIFHTVWKRQEDGQWRFVYD